MQRYFGLKRHSSERHAFTVTSLKRFELDEGQIEDSSDATESEEEDEHAVRCRWKLRLQQSVYDEALLTPVVLGHVNGFCSRTFVVSVLSAYMVLVVNGVLQFVVTGKVGRLTEKRREEVASKLWGLCKERRPWEMPFKRLLDAHPSDDVYFSCGSLAVTMMSHVSNVDGNSDGFWSAAEAKELSGEWESKYDKRADLHKVWKYYMQRFQGHSPEHCNKSAQLSKAEKGAIPMEWMHQQQSNIDLCIATNPKLCGNLEARGILEAKFPDITDANDRIAFCEDHLSSTCPAVFGQIFRLYQHWSKELCGDVSSTWLSEKGIIAVDFSLVQKYVKDLDSITTEYYFVFLVVILLIWVMCMLEELRVIISWWMVLVFFPTRPQNGKPAVEILDDRVRVHAIPRTHKIATLVLNLGPRTAICILLSYIGSVFLIRADDYSELILNSVALGFLIEIDNMLFAAVSQEREKDMVDSCEPLEVKHTCCRFFGGYQHHLPVGITYTALILSTTFGLIYHSYTKDRGKYNMGDALRCLCQAAGDKCVAAQVLGNHSSVVAYLQSEL